MEDKKLNLIAGASITCLIILIIVLGVTLKVSKTFFLVLGVDIGLIFSIVALIVIRWHFNKRRKVLETRFNLEDRELRGEYSFLRKVAGVPTKFRYKEIEEATDNFQSLLGQGASASVYKGILSDGTAVAVKRIDGQDHGEKEFRSEVSAIASVQHVNLVRLLGYCIVPSGSRFLVYDFISNGSLDSWIFPRSGERRRNRPEGCLSWDLRYKVAVDVARAISYLHHDCRAKILHLDVKPENILLDENYRAIVSDFGLSKLMPKDQSRIITTIRGTRGYLAPEWLLENGVTEKTDIYSYGMVLLEMIGGRRNVCMIEDTSGPGRARRRWNYFPKIVCEKLREGRVMDVVDSRLRASGGIDEREVKRIIYVALWCIQERSRLRPSMALVVDMLEGRVVVDEPPETQMIVVDLLQLDEDEEEEGHSGRNWAGLTRNIIGSNRGLPIASAYSFTMSIVSPR